MFLNREWIEHHDDISKKRGWALFNADGVFSIQKLDCPEEGEGQLEDDAEAFKVVIQDASRGDKTSLLALFLDGKPCPEDEDIWIPDQLG